MDITFKNYLIKNLEASIKRNKNSDGGKKFRTQLLKAIRSDPLFPDIDPYKENDVDRLVNRGSTKHYKRAHYEECFSIDRSVSRYFRGMARAYTQNGHQLPTTYCYDSDSYSNDSDWTTGPSSTGWNSDSRSCDNCGHSASYGGSDYGNSCPDCGAGEYPGGYG